MMGLVVRVVSVLSRVSPRLGARIAWYLWAHPRGRANTRYPTGVNEFSLKILGRELGGYVMGDGEPVFLLHGWGGASTDMAPLAMAISEAGYRAVAMDLPGHGSDRGSYADAFQMAAAVDAAVHRFGPPRSVVAHSFGAVVAFAAFQHGGPQSAVLVAPAVRGQRFLDGLREHLNLGDRAFAIFEQRFVGFAGPYMMDVMAGNGDVLGADMLVLHDPADDRTSFADSAEYVASRPATKLVEVPDSGHKGILRDGLALTETVAFISRSG